LDSRFKTKGTTMELRPVSLKWSNQPGRGTKSKKGGKSTELG